MKDIRVSINQVREDLSRIAVYLDEMADLSERTFHDVVGFELEANTTIEEKKAMVDFLEHAVDRSDQLNSFLENIKQELGGKR